MTTRRLLLLGGLATLRPVIDTARSVGCHVVTADYLPDNPAHRLADEYQFASVTDAEAVERVAREIEADGILSFGVDPGVATAAVVAERLGLPFQGSAEAVGILQEKSRFRKFLADNGFNTPRFREFIVEPDDDEALAKTVEMAKDIAAAWQRDDCWPVIVKPVDNAGSKGVSRVDDPGQLPEAFKEAALNSRCRKVIMEQFIIPEGPPSDSDCFSVGGRLVSVSFSDQHFDASATNPYTPSAFDWPSTMPMWAQEQLRRELQRLCSLLRLRDGIYNVETRLGRDGKTYIMEFSPRGGGNRYAEVLDRLAGTNLVADTVRASLGMELLPLGDPEYKGFPSLIVIHSDREGRFAGIEMDDELREAVVETELRVSPGDKIYPFTGANRALGTLILHFDSREAQKRIVNDIGRHLKVRRLKT